MIQYYVDKIISLLSKINWKNPCDVREARKIITDLLTEYTNKIK